MSKLYIGVDIGGTSIVAARFSASELRERTEGPTGADRPAEKIMESLYEAIENVISDAVVGIGIGMPGFMNSETGEILQIKTSLPLMDFALNLLWRSDLIFPLFRVTMPIVLPSGKPIMVQGKSTIPWWV